MSKKKKTDDNFYDENDKVITLNNLKKNQTAIVLKIDIPNSTLRRRLLDMGLTKNTEVTVVNVAPFGSPITIKLRDYQLSVRKKDLENVIVEVVSW